MSWILFALTTAIFLPSEAHALTLGSKKFTESVILAEAARFALAGEGADSQHRAELGGTRILWNALLAGDIDAYPEYSGTIEEELIQRKTGSFGELRAALKELGIGVAGPVGFNNTYAIGMKADRAAELGIGKISDLARYPGLKIGWGDEFRRRNDGWPGLKERYHLPHRLVRGLDHDIAYRAMENGDIELTDLYSTDAEIEYYGLKVLEDDLGYFPRYEALFLYRLDSAARHPELKRALDRFTGKISEAEMVAMNRRAKLDKIPADAVAAEFLREKFGLDNQARMAGRSERILLRSREHIELVGISLAAAILVAIPLGILAARSGFASHLILGVVGTIQTIPALALLVVLIRPLNLLGLSGIGDTPALIALFLYSLLPIVRSTHAGLMQIPPGLKETASVLNLSAFTRLVRIDLPLALPSILSGVKTSAVLNVGFATLGALVGAGGFGQPILTGIRLDDYGLILEGAVPAALLALLAQQLFDLLERWLVSPGLRK